MESDPAEWYESPQVVKPSSPEHLDWTGVDCATAVVALPCKNINVVQPPFSSSLRRIVSEHEFEILEIREDSHRRNKLLTLATCLLDQSAC